MRRAALALLLLAIALVPTLGQEPGSDAAAVPAVVPTSGPPTAPADPGATHPTAPGEADGGHGNPVAPVLLALTVVLVGAKLGGWGAERFRQPAVLGELLAGVVLGNLALVGFGGLEFIGSDLGIHILAELGVVILLFEVGLESNVTDMLSVGWSSLAVACLGVVAPFFLGWGVSAWLLPDEETLAHIFIGAILCATSVGITARVLTDLGKVQSRESRIVLGAAVIDDVLGLVILAVVTGSIQAANAGSELDATSVLAIVGKAGAFLVGAIVIGTWLAPRLFRLASLLRVRGMLLVASLGFCFLLAYLANAIELAPIVGAFAAGLVLDQVHYRTFTDRGEHRLEELLHPVALVLFTIFFVRMGIEVDLSTFARVEVLGFAALLTVAAAVGKLTCAAGVLERGLDRLSVAVGMVPRGEVGLIFAGIGSQMVLHGQRVVPPAVFSACVIMVIVTTLVTPPALKLTLARGDARKARAMASGWSGPSTGDR
jgi:Kef-type K+ transport system membrane component KefB